METNIIVGDFNADLNKGKHFDNLLKKLNAEKQTLSTINVLEYLQNVKDDQSDISDEEEAENMHNMFDEKIDAVIQMTNSNPSKKF